ncbi:CvpA family protein [Chloroflexota bacterium]
MNWLDIVILAVMGVAAFFGLRLGIIKTVVSLAGLIVGVILAGRYYLPFSEQLTFIPQATVAKIVAFAIISIGVMVIASVLARLLKWLTSLMMLGWVNSIGGAAFGLLIAAIGCGALLAAWVSFFGDTSIITESMIARVLLDQFPLVLSLLPSQFDGVRSFFH